MQRKQVPVDVDVSHEEGSEIRGQVQGPYERNLIRGIFKRHGASRETTLPPKEELKERMSKKIEDLHLFSEKSQPSNKANVLAGVADANLAGVSLSPQTSFLALGIAATELYTFLKNRKKEGENPSNRKKVLKELREIESMLTSKLKSKLEASTSKEARKNVKSLIRETESLFHEINTNSKAGMTTALNSRMEGIAASVGAFLCYPFYKPVTDALSIGLRGVLHAVPLQFHPYMDWLIAAVDPAVFLAAQVGLSLVFASVLDVLIKRSVNKDLENRDSDKFQLLSRSDKLIDRIFRL